MGSHNVQALILFWVSVVGVIYLLKQHHWRYQMVFCPEYLQEYTPSDFPRNTVRSNALKYQQMTDDGFKEMKRSTIIVAIMLRDMADRMDSVQERVLRLVTHFKDYMILVVENNSTDDTRLLLKQWRATNPRVRILGCDVEDDVCEIPLASIKTVGHAVYYRRIAKMVYLRNLYLDEIKKLGSYDYTLIWDIDVVGSLYTDGVANSLGWMVHQPQIQMISAYGAYRKFGYWVYYDTYAHQDIGERFDFKYKLRHDFEKGIFNQRYVGDDLVRVESGFGGCTLYRTAALLPSNVRYTMSEDGNIECEHTRLHHHLTHKYMNPSMINLILNNP